MTHPSPADVTARLRQASELSDLSSGGRLLTKVDMSARGVSRRLRRASELRAGCLALGRLRSLKHRGDSPAGGD